MDERVLAELRLINQKFDEHNRRLLYLEEQMVIQNRRITKLESLERQRESTSIRPMGTRNTLFQEDSFPCPSTDIHRRVDISLSDLKARLDGTSQSKIMFFRVR